MHGDHNRVEDELLVGDQLVRAEGGHRLEEEVGGAGQVADGHSVEALVGAQAVLAVPVAAL